MSKVEIRPTTAEDIIALSGHRQGKTVRAMTVLYDGKVACIAGITIDKGMAMAFSDQADLDVPKLTIWRAAKQLKSFIDGMRIPAVAIADPEKPCSRRFLEALGFKYVDEYEEYAIFQL